MPDGSWKREGKPEMMVYQDSAQLNFPNEKVVSCHADHSQIAKLRRGESGAYPDIKSAIKKALLRVAEEQVNVGLSRLQLQPEIKAVDEERSRHNGDYIKEPVPEPSTVLAGESPLEDVQSQGSSIQEPPGETADVLHDKDVVSTPSTAAFDDREFGSKVQDKQAIPDPTIVSPSTQIISRDDEELLKGGMEALKISIPRATDRWDALTSPTEKEGLEKAASGATEPPLCSELCSASREGDVEKVRSLLTQGYSIHESSEDLVDPNRDAFLLAVRNGRLDFLKLLIQHGCDVSKRNLNGMTALHLISADPDIKPKANIESLVILLLDHGVPLEAKDPHLGITALSTSAILGKISIAECLLDHGADIHSASNDGCTALHNAVLADCYKIVVFLISKGANIDAATKTGVTALHIAAYKGHHEVVALLISKGVDISSTTKEGCTALYYAAKEGHYEVVALLISKGADISSVNSSGFNALHITTEEDHHEVVALLISKGAPLEARTLKYSYTPLHVSCLAQNGSGKSTKLLLEAGADKEAVSSFGSRRALHLAAVQGGLEALNELLAFGVEIDAPSSNDWRALHHARYWGHWRIVSALLAKGANPFLRDKDRARPSRIGWDPDSNASPEDMRKCTKLLYDAERAWKDKEKQRLKESGAGRFTRFIVGFNM